MNTQSYSKMSVEGLTEVIESKQNDLEEVQKEIDNLEEDYLGELIHEKVELMNEIKQLTKLLKEKELKC
jgi:DNA mismatch repair ATPase MutS